MPFQLSPGVITTETDMTTIVPAVSSTVGGLAGEFAWGPIGELKTISNELELVKLFGKPTDATAEYFFTAANFLSYGDNLKISRAHDAILTKNASPKNAILVGNKDDLETASASAEFVARYPGTLGNSLKVVVADNATNSSTTYFSGDPATSPYAANLNCSNDEIHIAVIDEDGAFSGTAGTVLEKFEYISKALDAKNADGTSNYYKTVINDNSEYIFSVGQPVGTLAPMDAQTANWGKPCSEVSGAYDSFGELYEESFVDGANGDNIDIASAYDLFNDEEVQVNLLMCGPEGSTNINYVYSNIVSQRLDCMLFASPEKADVVGSADNGTKAQNVADFFSTVNLDSSYVVFDSGWKYQYDKYNSVYRWIPLNGDVAGLCARTDMTNDPWFSPAGFTRGQIKNCIKLAFNPTKTSRDILYQANVNPVVSFAGEGTVLYGDKTSLAKPSAFDRINVRRLFITLEKAISTASKYSLFDFNDEFTRANFKNMVDPYLRDVKGRRGIEDFMVVCDETNNDEQVISSNNFVADIYIKPNYSINFIQLNFIASNSGVGFTEIGG